MRSRQKLIVTCVLFLTTFLSPDARAQDSTLVVGTVVAASTGQPLSYATYSISPGGIRRFTGENGVFGAKLPARGSYHLVVRQLGYAQLDTTIATAASTTVRIRLALTAVPHRLASVRTTARSACSGGGVAGNSGDLGPALEAVRMNAEREMLLRQTYPFTYRLARTTRIDGAEAWRRSADTAEFMSNAMDPYRPGGVVRDRVSSSGSIREMRIPQLTDLANDTFLANHCFSYGGLQKFEGAVVYEIDFDPLGDISTPDVRGSIMLDTASFQIRRARFQLTNGERLMPPVAGLDVTTSYRDVFRGVSLFQEVKSVQSFTSTGAVENRQHQTETQRLLGVHFLRGSPDEVSPLVVALAADSARAAAADSAAAANAVARARAAADSVALKVASMVGRPVLTGTVVDSLNRPLAGTYLRNRHDVFLARTDALGGFTIEGLRDTAVVLVRSPGYAPAAFSVALPATGARRVRIVLTTDGVALAPVVVAESDPPREAPSDFLDRRSRGQGTYFTSEDIAKAKPRKISDMLRRVSGLRIQMKGEIYSNRGMSSINEGTNACMHGLAIFVDNNQIGGGDKGDPTTLVGDQTRTNPEYVGPNSDLRSQLDAIDPAEVAAIEVYNGPATVPAALRNAASACGAIYIWTKAVR